MTFWLQDLAPLAPFAPLDRYDAQYMKSEKNVSLREIILEHVVSYDVSQIARKISRLILRIVRTIDGCKM